MNCWVELKSEIAIQILKPFLEENILNEKMRICIRSYAHKIYYIQKRVRDQLAIRFAKVEVLSNYWDKMIGQIQTIASRKKDKVASDLVLKFILIPKEVRIELLS